MIRRILRRLLGVAVLGALAGAAAKLLRQRRSAASGAPGGDRYKSSPLSAPVEKGSGPGEAGPPEQALVEPTMLQDVVDRKAPGPEAEPGAGEGQAGGAGAPGSGQGWVEPDGDSCPATHPIKAKDSSSIYHRPGMANYDRTTPDRCYRDEAAAEADGYRSAKR